MLIPLQLTSDARLVRRVLGGRRDEFGVLVERYYGAVQSVARARLENTVDAEDVAQEAFVSAYRKLDTLMEPHKFGPWVMAIARNAAVSWIRRRKSEVLVADVAMVAGPVDAPPVERAELQRIVRAKLQDMEPEQREILMLFYYGGKTVGEVASLLEITKDAANKRLQRAREALGSEFLKSIGESRQATDKSADGKRAKRSVMAAIASAPVVWEGKAAAAGTAALVAVKVLIAALAVVAIGVGVTVGVKYTQSEPAEPVAATTQETAPVIQQLAPAAAPVESSEPATAEEQETETTGPGRIEVVLLDGETLQPVASADVTAELVTWGPRDIPPQTTLKKSGTPDGQGMFIFENMPLGMYCIAGATPTLCGANDVRVSAKNLKGSVRVWMRPRISVSGRLIGPDDGPVAGAVIYPIKYILMPKDIIGYTEIASVRATTGSDGSFTFPMIIPGAWQFYILPPNLPPVVTDYKMLERELILKLEAAGSIAGRVLDAGTGEGRSHVVIRAFQGDKDYLGNPSQLHNIDEKQYGWLVAAEAESGPDGSFRLSNVAPDKYMMETGDAALLNTSPGTEFEVKSGAETAVDVRVASCATVLGRVYNRDTGEGLAGLGIYGAGWPPIKTDSNGEYMITGLTPGSHSLRVVFPTADGGYDFPTDSSMETTVTVTYGQVLEHADFAVKPAATVKGKVVDRSGVPVEGATVTRTGWDSVKTGVDGSFSEMLFSVENLRFMARKDGWQSEEVSVTDVTQEVVLRLTLPANGAIYGTALSADGKPLVLYEVNAYVMDESSDPPSARWPCGDARIGPTGEFALENLAAGLYEVSVQASPPGPDTGIVQQIRLAENQVLRNVVLRPQAWGALTISGRLITPDGGPIYAAGVQIPWGQSVRAGQDGAFVLKGLQEGTYTLLVQCAGYSCCALENVEAGTQNLIVKLTAPAVLSGTVTDARTGSPVTSFMLNAFTDPPVNSETVSTNEAGPCNNAQGRFEITSFAAMRVRLAISADGYAPWEQEVTLEGGKSSELAVQLEPGAVVRGVVTDSGGNPVAGAEIRWHWIESRPLVPQTLRSDENGAFETRALPEGVTVRLTARHSAYGPDCVDVVLSRTVENEVHFVLQPAGALEIRVLVDGEPTSRCYVDSETACVAEAPRFSEELKALVLQGLRPGEVEFTAFVFDENGGEREQTFTATVVAGQTTPVEVSFKSHEGLDGNKEE